MIAVLDYKGGNLASVSAVLEHLGLPHVVTDDPAAVRAAERVLFPGVGAAAASMDNLRRSGLDASLREALDAGKPVLGICIGCQLLLDSSQEDGGTACLGLVPGEVKRFAFPRLPGAPKVPHMGWNPVAWRQEHPVAAGIPSGTMFYYVHSYYPAPSLPELTLGTSEYGGLEFVAAFGRKNLVATQFHPEKSGEAGLRLLANFASWTP
jgi:glutamine amidotransferase